MSDEYVFLTGLLVTAALVVAYKRKQKTQKPEPDDRYTDSGDDWDYDDNNLDTECDAADTDADDAACDDSDD